LKHARSSHISKGNSVRTVTQFFSVS